MPRMLILSVAAFLISSCSSTPTKDESPVSYNSKYSYAKNILSAAGMPDIHKMKDYEISETEYENFLSDSRGISGAAEGAIVGSAASSIILNNTVGSYSIGSILDSPSFTNFVAMGFLSALATPKNPMFKGHVAVWMPHDMASTTDNFKETLKELIKDTHIKSVPDGYTLTTSKLKPKLGSEYASYIITGGVCDKGRETYRATCSSTLNHVIYEDSFGYSSNFREGYRPTFFDEPGLPAWVAYLEHSVNINGFYCRLPSSYKATEAEVAECNKFNATYAENFKRNLPTWIYFYTYDKNKKAGWAEQGGSGLIYPLVVVK
jgi:hypothetical protein